MDVFNKYNSLEKNIFIPILERFNVSEKDRKYLYISVIMAIIKNWIINDCKDEISDIEEIIVKCTSNGI